LIYDQLRVTPYLEALDPEFGSNSETVDQGFILGGIVRCREV
jgi:hypothetical protein